MSQVAIGQGGQGRPDLMDAFNPLGDIEREFDNFEDLAAFVADRVVGAVNPDSLAGLADAAEFAGLKVPLAEAPPELGIVR